MPRIDLSIEQGSTFSKSLTIINSDGLPVSFTGASAQMQLRQTLSSASPAITLSTANGRITLSSGGTITLSIAATDTDDLTPGTYVYDLEVTSGSTVRKYMSGKATVVGEVTR